MLGKAVTRIATTLVAALCFVAVAVTGGHAQGTTGKIQGRVVSSAGQPIASAQVTVDGTNLGNITNDDGFYFVNQVPAGLHTVRAQSIGYRTVATTNQRVLAGQTTTLNFTLEQAAVELEALVVTGERNPLVPRDQVSSKAIVTGETIDELPIDNASSIILLAPGVIETNNGFSIRGSREGEHAVYIDGVPMRSLRSGASSNLDLPTNALAQVDVTTGGVAARYGNAQSGLVNYVTKTGAAALGGTLSFYTDDMAPQQWRTGFSRAELSLGGPLLMDNLSFFVGGTASGNKYRSISQGYNGLTRYVPSGVDTTIRMARTAQTTGGSDSVDVVIPNFIEWDNGPTSPSYVGDTYNLTAKLSYGIGKGSKLDLTYYRNRSQSLSRGNLTGAFNPDSWTGSYGTQNTLTLGGYFMVRQTAESQIALDLKASYQRDWGQSGSVASDYLESHLSPAFGFNMKAVDFIMDPDAWPVNEKLVNASRANVLPINENVMLPGRADLTTRQGVEGVASNLRLNPYALRSDFSTSGSGNVTQAYNYETRWYTTATIDWQMNRFNRLWLGGELTLSKSAGRNIPLYQNRTYPYMYEPSVGGLFLQDRLDIGDVVLEGGLRLDYFDPSGDFSRVPGFVFNVPDSLRADMWTVAAGEGPVLDRLVAPTGDCGGTATAKQRTNSLGQVGCMNNFIAAKKRSILSPKLAVSFPVTASSTFRLSYGQNSQAPRLTSLFSSNDEDLAGGTANTNWAYGRDVEIPTTVAFEAGYRQVFGGNTVIDVSAYSKTNRNALAYRKLRFTDPNTGGDMFINSLQNADYSLTKGVDVVFDRRVSELLDLAINYSFLDAKGTGSDPSTYLNLLLRGNTNLGVITGQPIEPPEVLMTLDQSRAHTLSGVATLTLGSDIMEENRVANAILSDISLFGTLRVGSGLPYTRLENIGAGNTGPPTAAGLDGQPAERINASRTGWEKRFDLRLVKGFEVLGKGARLFADWRNPLGLTNQDRVFLETGTDKNAVHREDFITNYLSLATWDGDTNIDDFNIKTEAETSNPVNQYMILEAERRFGNGDGTFTVAEQRHMITDWYNLNWGTQLFRETNRYLRRGFERTF
ncbi:MAG: hypothetical protein FIB01_08035 [Gemmatimonadetes bacterium]|nr:hypothetical protein [Gemmatimonadota bacterium]